MRHFCNKDIFSRFIETKCVQVCPVKIGETVSSTAHPWFKGGADPTFASVKVKNAIGRIGLFHCQNKNVLEWAVSDSVDSECWLYAFRLDFPRKCFLSPDLKNANPVDKLYPELLINLKTETPIPQWQDDVSTVLYQNWITAPRVLSMQSNHKQTLTIEMCLCNTSTSRGLKRADQKQNTQFTVMEINDIVNCTWQFVLPRKLKHIWCPCKEMKKRIGSDRHIIFWKCILICRHLQQVWYHQNDGLQHLRYW